MTDAPPEPSVAARTRVVGIGASAGGLAALGAFVRHLPADPGVAFVVVSHLSPSRESHLPSILATGSPIPVVTATDGMRVERDRMYVLPPGHEIELADGALRLVGAEPGPRAPIDRFFRSLASTLGKDSACVVLSGTGADGTQGLKAVKEEGGLTVAQLPSGAEYEPMPRSAIATGLVDLVLSPEEMAPKIVSLLSTPTGHLLAEGDPRRAYDVVHDSLREVLTLLRIRSGHDFSQYKRATLLRRVARRMQVCGAADLTAYLEHLRADPAELSALLRDFLISVTAFFRDPDAFATLDREVLPQVLGSGEPGMPARIWVTACATGEEAYSLAMLCAEHAARMSDPRPFQIFATDIDESAIQQARAGRYPETIAADVGAERLNQFFDPEEGRYRVKKEIRERVLFSVHNILRDPPFSRIDLVSCRNLLIYLNREAQERALAALHFALRPEGFLFLGSSESAEGSATLFAPLDAKRRIYVRRQAQVAMPLPVGYAHVGPVPVPASRPGDLARPHSIGEIHAQAVARHAPPSALVDAELEVAHLSEGAGRFLVVGGGEPTHQLLRLIHPALRLELRAAVYAVRHGEVPASREVAMELDGRARLVTLRVRPVEAPESARGMLLVSFEEREPPATEGEARAATPSAESMEPVVRQLEDELHRTRDQLRSTIEQYETSLEEVKSSNEELQSINEELRSATEELETSKEELQSVNEELTTLNHELKDKVDEVSRANADLQNLMTSTEIAVVFVDRELRVKRFTPKAQDVFNVIPSDVGRPFSHLTHRLEYPQIERDAASVLQHLRAIERDVDAIDGRRFLARLHPYRSLDDRIEGVVLTFLDVTDLKNAEATMRSQATTLALAERAAGAGVWELTADAWHMSDECRRMYGFEEPAPSIDAWLARLHEHDRARARAAVDGAIARGQELDLEVRVMHPSAGLRRVWHVGKAARDVGPGARAAGLAIDLTDRRRTEAELRESEQRFRLALRSAPVMMLSQDVQLRYTWGYAHGREIDFVGKTDRDLHPAAEAERLESIKHAVLATGTGRREEVELTRDGERVFYDLHVEPIRVDDRVVGIVCAALDVTASKLAELALRDGDRRKDEFLATLAHELRNPLAPMTAALGIQELAEGDVAKTRAAREIMQRQVAHIVRLVDDLLDVSRITRGKIQLRKTDVELGEVFRAAVEATPSLEQEGRHLSVELPHPIGIHADATRLTQVVANLLGNAAKYTRAGGHVVLSGQRLEDGGIEIVVRDDGVGIAPDVLPYVFEMFSQAPDVLEHARGGLGIGLTLVRRIVELHGGTVEARSAGPDRGSEFVVRLPPATARSVEPAAAARAPVAEARPGAPARTVARAKRVLVVDDLPDVTDAVAELLRLLGHDPHVARDGASALAVARQVAPEVVLLDIGLPDRSGYDVCRELRGLLGPDAALVAVTGWGQASDRAKARDAGFDRHVVKPLTVAALVSIVGDVTA